MSETRPDAGDIVLPTQLSGMLDYLTVYAASGKTPRQITDETARIGRTYQLTADSYRRAYNGAPAAVRKYTTTDFSVVFTVVAVRANSPPLTAGVLDDPSDQGLIALPVEVRTIGTVSCLIRRFVHGPGDLNPLNQHTDECQRSGPDASIWIFAQGADSSAAQQNAVDAANTAYDALSQQ